MDGNSAWALCSCCKLLSNGFLINRHFDNLQLLKVNKAVNGYSSDMKPFFFCVWHSLHSQLRSSFLPVTVWYQKGRCLILFWSVPHPVLCQRQRNCASCYVYVTGGFAVHPEYGGCPYWGFPFYICEVVIFLPWMPLKFVINIIGLFIVHLQYHHVK